MRVLIVFLFALLLSSCMLLFNLTLPDGIYVVGEWNGWEPSESDRMELSGDLYEFSLPVSSITFFPSNEDPQDHIGWYKVVVVEGGDVKVSSSIPVWKENLGSATVLTIYASPSLMEDGLAVGVGDSEKEEGTWYVAGEFNSWTLVPMRKEGNVFVYEVEKSGRRGDTIKYKIARSTIWKPYETQFDGRNYNAGYGQDAVFTADRDFSKLRITYDPRLSILKMEAIE